MGPLACVEGKESGGRRIPGREALFCSDILNTDKKGTKLIPYLRETPVRIQASRNDNDGLTLFVLGSLKVKVTGKNFIRSGLEILILGGLAAAAAYGIGFGLHLLIS